LAERGFVYERGGLTAWEKLIRNSWIVREKASKHLNTPHSKEGEEKGWIGGTLDKEQELSLCALAANQPNKRSLGHFLLAVYNDNQHIT
jgi:hypothetical protein